MSKGKRNKKLDYSRVLRGMIVLLVSLLFVLLFLSDTGPLSLNRKFPILHSVSENARDGRGPAGAGKASVGGDEPGSSGKEEEQGRSGEEADLSDGERESGREAEREPIELIFAGDLLIHLPILNQGINPDGTADFSWLFRYTEDIFHEADLAFANMEGTITGKPYYGYPVFRAPKELAQNIRDAGFDYLTTVNNHAMDAGLEGVFSTLETLQEAGIGTIGTRLSEKEKGYVLVDCKGIKLAFSAFSYETARSGGKRTLNGAAIPPEAEKLIDSFCVEPGLSDIHAADEKSLRDRVAAMRAEKADLVIFFMHWGIEYAREADSWQKHYAQILADAGVDLVIGTHPHVVQPLVTLPANNPSGQMICYYSLGNFVSNQQPETGNSDGRAEEGALARVLIEKTEEGADILLADYIPLYMYKTYPGYPIENKTYGWVLPVEAALQEPEKYEATALVPRLEKALASSREVMGKAIKKGP